jgi:hypothetical protein
MAAGEDVPFGGWDRPAGHVLSAVCEVDQVGGGVEFVGQGVEGRGQRSGVRLVPKPPAVVDEGDLGGALGQPEEAAGLGVGAAFDHADQPDGGDAAQGLAAALRQVAEVALEPGVGQPLRDVTVVEVRAAGRSQVVSERSGHRPGESAEVGSQRRV